MKYRWDKKYLSWGITAFLVVASSICFYYVLFHGVKVQGGLKKIVTISSPVIYGLIIAYLLTPIVNMLEMKIAYPLCKKWNIQRSKRVNKNIRFVAIMISLIFVVFILYTLCNMLIPQLSKSIQSIGLQLPLFLNNATTWFNNIVENNEMLENFVNENNFHFDSAAIIEWFNNNIESNIKNITNLFSTVYYSLFSLVKTLFYILVGIIISVYVIGSKELFAGQAKKIVYAVFEIKTANSFIKDMRFIHKTFIGFLSGKIIDSIIIGFLCFIGTTIMGTPYALLISVVIGVTNVIPFFGPYLGAIPCSFLLLMISPIQCLYFIIFILILQQIDGNIIGPKILGDSTGLSSFWVIFAITIFGGLFGIFGMFIGVPVFAVIFAGFRKLFNIMLKKKGLPIDTKNYLKVAEIKNSTFVDNAEKVNKPSNSSLLKLIQKIKDRRGKK